MKRLIYYLGLAILLTFLSLVLGTKPVKAESLEIEAKTLLKLVKEEKPKKTAAPAPVIEAPVAVVYTVLEGDSLVKIAETYNVEWQRLWAKNTQLTSPDTLNVGEQITIPFPDEVLTREVPVSSLPSYTPNVAPTGNNSGNGYYWGWCTFWAKEKRPDLPNSLGNAYTWASRARALGYQVSSTPMAKAIGQLGNHVVYVESVNDNGTFNYSAMNDVDGWGRISYGTHSPNGWQFIH